MKPVLLDLSETQLALHIGDKQLSSPAIAYSDGSSTIFGNPALAKYRLEPRNIRADYLGILSLHKLSPSFGNARHNADLVYSHLKGLLDRSPETTELLVFASSEMTQEQLSLLIGILESLNIKVVAVINRSLAAAIQEPESSAHISIQWRRCIATPIKRENGNLTTGEPKIIDGYGLLDLYEQMIELIANQCVQQTRFDIRHSARSEQLLFDRLDEVLSNLSTGSEFSLNIDQHAVRLTSEMLSMPGKQLASKLIDILPSCTSTWLVDQSLAIIPGVLKNGKNAPKIFKNLDGRAGAFSNEWFDTRGPILINHIPILGKRDPKVETADTETPIDKQGKVRPSHVLVENVAYLLEYPPAALQEHLEFHLDEDSWWLHASNKSKSIRINGKTVSTPQIIRLGDILEVGASAAHFIRVEEN